MSAGGEVRPARSTLAKFGAALGAALALATLMRMTTTSGDSTDVSPSSGASDLSKQRSSGKDSSDDEEGGDIAFRDTP